MGMNRNEQSRYDLSRREQQLLHGTLRRSVRVVKKGGPMYVPTNIEAAIISIVLTAVAVGIGMVLGFWTWAH